MFLLFIVKETIVPQSGDMLQGTHQVVYISQFLHKFLVASNLLYFPALTPHNMSSRRSLSEKSTLIMQKHLIRCKVNNIFPIKGNNLLKFATSYQFWINYHQVHLHNCFSMSSVALSDSLIGTGLILCLAVHKAVEINVKELLTTAENQCSTMLKRQ